MFTKKECEEIGEGTARITMKILKFIVEMIEELKNFFKFFYSDKGSKES
jgi:hypothetical protein